MLPIGWTAPCIAAAPHGWLCAWMRGTRMVLVKRYISSFFILQCTFLIFLTELDTKDCLESSVLRWTSCSKPLCWRNLHRRRLERFKCSKCFSNTLFSVLKRGTKLLLQHNGSADAMCAHVYFGSMNAACVQVKHHTCVIAHTTACLWGSPQTDCRGAVLCRMHYLIRVNFSNNPLLARVAHGGGGGAESLITFLAAASQRFLRHPVHISSIYCCWHKSAAPLNGRKRGNKTSCGATPVFKLLINSIDLWSALSLYAMGQLLFQ